MSEFSRTGVAREKREMRRRLLAARRAIPGEEQERLDAAIAAALAPLVAGRVVAGYVPMPGEPGGPALMAVLATAATLLLPVLREDLDLDWAPYDGHLRAGRHGLREPAAPRLGVDAVRDASLLVVPAVAVDRLGIRLGRGGGSYDRALARVTAPSLAPLYPHELVDAVPAEPHDRPVDGAVTPSGVWRRTGRQAG